MQLGQCFEVSIESRYDSRQGLFLTYLMVGMMVWPPSLNDVTLAVSLVILVERLGE